MLGHNELGIFVGSRADYEDADSRGHARHDARLRFLWWVSVLAPDVLKSLHDEVSVLPPESWRGGVEAWASRFNLNAEWIKTAALNTTAIMADPERYSRFRAVQQMSREHLRGVGRPIDEPDLEWRDVLFALPVTRSAAELIDLLGLPGWWKDDPPFCFDFRAFNPLQEPEAPYRAEANKPFAAALDIHVAAAVSSAEEGGAKRSKRKRGPSKNKHYEWFVRYQVLGEGFKEIRRGEIRRDRKRAVPEATIQRACRDVSERIDLPRRSRK